MHIIIFLFVSVHDILLLQAVDAFYPILIFTCKIVILFKQLRNVDSLYLFIFVILMNVELTMIPKH